MSIKQSQILVPFFLICGLTMLPQISENIYSSALPNIRDHFSTSIYWTELSLSTYFWGFALGVLFWGNVSDFIGRRICILLGLIIYIISCILCIKASSINQFLALRVLQAFGASVGSVVVQTIARDLYVGRQRGVIFSKVVMYLALAPAFGLTLGGILTEKLGWESNFTFLVLVATMLLICSYFKLQETKPSEIKVNRALLFPKLLQLSTDSYVWGCVIIVGIYNGLVFSFYAEGPFIFIENLKLSPSKYGLLGLVFAFCTMVGSKICRMLLQSYKQIELIHLSSKLLLIIGLLFLVLKPLNISGDHYIIAIISLMGLFFVICSIAISNVLSTALANYQEITGVAGAIFGFAYYVVVALQVQLMSYLHNSSIYTFCYFFAGFAFISFCATRLCIKKLDL